MVEISFSIAAPDGEADGARREGIRREAARDSLIIGAIRR